MNTRNNPPTTRPQKVPKSVGNVGKRLKVRNILGNTYAVDGDAVCRKYANFSDGAHHLWARFVPFQEFWIEKRKGAAGRFLAAHEWFEYLLMEMLGWKYQKAHNAACALELDLRKAWAAGQVTWQSLTPIWRRHIAHHFRSGSERVLTMWATELARSMCRYH